MGNLVVGLVRILPLYTLLLVLPTVAAYGSQQTLNATVRDFQKSHPDFEKGIPGLVKGLAGAALPQDKKPVFVATPGAGAITNASTFAQWYTDVPGVNQSTTLPLTFNETAPGSGIFDLNVPNFFPIDGVLFGNEGLSHNYHFTLELHTTFTYKPGQVFNFTGDDDMWVYINNRLVVDLGGVHDPVSASVALDTLGLTPGNTYNFDLYFAERHTFSSVFHIQTSIAFTPHPTLRYPGESNAPILCSTEKPQGLAPNLIVVVHGCCTDENDLEDWKKFGSSIQNAILQNQIAGTWEIVVWNWTNVTRIKIPDVAYYGAFLHGQCLGREIVNPSAKPGWQYKYVHFITHSAGSRLIYEAAKYIRIKDNTPPFIHSTFLDAYCPLLDQMIYTVYSDYAEQYVDLGLPLTDTDLWGAYNFDITNLPTKPNIGTRFRNGWPNELWQQYHFWPVDWYQQSIDNPALYRFGFPLSFENSRKEDPFNFYTELKQSLRSTWNLSAGDVCVLTSNTECRSDPIALLRPIISYTRLVGSLITGGLGAIQKSLTDAVEWLMGDPLTGVSTTLKTGSPAWVEAPITTTRSFNLLKFDYEFLSTAGAQGIVTVFVGYPF